MFLNLNVERLAMTKYRVLISLLVLVHLLCCMPSSSAQESKRTKVAEGEYTVTTEGDAGAGPIETEVFHFSETWTLWRTLDGYDVEGRRTYESPRGQPHDNRFVAKLARNLQPLSITEFTHLVFRQDSGPLTCELLPRTLRCDSGAKDPVQRIDVQVALDRPYALIWPLSAFSFAGLTSSASTEGQTVPVQVVQLEEISERLPVLAIRSDGRIQYSGKSERTMTVSDKSWQPNMYHLAASPVGEMTIWTSPQGLLLALERPGWPRGRMQLVKFTQFADF
jgi:hypothetical protein